jgi:hypothetical protein
MKAGKKYKKKSPEKQVKEPSVVYNTDKGKSITIFNSFEEAEEDNYKWLASLTGEQHLQNAHELMKRIFAEDLKKNPTVGTKLTVVKQ